MDAGNESMVSDSVAHNVSQLPFFKVPLRCAQGGFDDKRTPLTRQVMSSIRCYGIEMDGVWDRDDDR